MRKEIKDMIEERDLMGIIGLIDWLIETGYPLTRIIRIAEKHFNVRPEAFLEELKLYI